jgi:hypothetical protein
MLAGMENRPGQTTGAEDNGRNEGQAHEVSREDLGLHGEAGGNQPLHQGPGKNSQ